MTFAEVSIRRPVLTVVISLLITLFGAICLTQLAVREYPAVDPPTISITTSYPGAAAEVVQAQITEPIEEAVNSVPGLQNVRSITSRGSAEIDLFFDWNSDMVLTLQRVDAVVARLQSELPPTVKIETHRLTFAAFPIIGYSLTSESVAPERLWEMATYDIKPRMNRLDGVATVVVQGGRVPEFQVTPDPARLAVAGITVTDILANLSKNASNAAKVVAAAVAAMPADRKCKCGAALAHALITDPKVVPESTRRKLELLVGKYLR